MNIDQTTELLEFLMGAYPGRFNATEATLRTWSDLLEDQDFESVMYRAKRFIAKSPHPPTIADLKKTRPPAIG